LAQDAIENMVKAIEEEEKNRKSVKEVPVEGGKPSSRCRISRITDEQCFQSNCFP
jgi:hypothetical protein